MQSAVNLQWVYSTLNLEFFYGYGNYLKIYGSLSMVAIRNNIINFLRGRQV